MGIVQIAIIGAGQLGSRHLQAMALLDRPAMIHVIDPSLESLRVAEDRYNQVNLNKGNIAVHYFQEMRDLSAYYDVVIIATSSNIRRMVIEQLLKCVAVKHLILEKVVFQLPQDFVDMDRLFKEKNIEVSVNCPRRMCSGYQMIQKAIEDEENIQVHIVGSKWDLGTNGIHMLDLVAYLCGNADINITTSQLSNILVESKRKGFYSFDGTLLGVAGKGCSFSITSHVNGDAPIDITISSNNQYFMIRERSGFCEIRHSSSKQEWGWKEEKYPMLFQSKLTQLCVQQIIDTGTSGLTSFAESWQLHLPILDVLKKHFNKLTESESDLCPIT